MISRRYLLVECKDVSARDKKVTELYVSVTKRFSKALLAVCNFDFIVERER